MPVSDVGVTLNSPVLNCITQNSLTAWDTKNQFGTTEEFLPSPSSIAANPVAVKGTRVENGFVFGDTSLAPAAWPLPSRESARQAEAETQRQPPVGVYGKGTSQPTQQATQSPARPHLPAALGDLIFQLSIGYVFQV